MLIRLLDPFEEKGEIIEAIELIAPSETASLIIENKNN